MSAVLIGEKPDSPELLSQSIDKTEVSRHFLVLCSDPNDGIFTASNCPGLPNPFDPYVFGNDGLTLSCWYKTRHAHRVSVGPQGCVWQVELDYSSPDYGEETGQYANPLLELPDLQFHTETRQIPSLGYFTGTGNALTGWKTSAGEPYLKPPMRDVSRIVLTYQVNQPISYDVIGTTITYKDKTNSLTFFGQQPGFCKMNSISASIKQLKLDDSTFYDYLRVEYVIQITDDFNNGWDIALLDYGNYYLSGGTGVQVKFLTANAHPIHGFLSGGNIWTGAPNYMPVQQIYQRVDFTPLNLPQSFASCRPQTRYDN